MHPTVARPALLAGLYLLCAGAWLLVWGMGAEGVCGQVLFSGLLIFFLERRHRLGREHLRQGLRRRPGHGPASGRADHPTGHARAGGRRHQQLEIGGPAIPASELTLQRRDGSPVTVFLAN